jgi:hypothetical protein
MKCKECPAHQAGRCMLTKKRVSKDWDACKQDISQFHPKFLHQKIRMAWPCVEGKALNPKGRQRSKEKKPAKCYL